MPWGRVDDSFYDHPKVEALEDQTGSPPRSWKLAAIGLHMLAVSWSNRHLTDGHIPASRVERLASLPRTQAATLAQALVEVGLWERVADGYLIHDFGEFNKLREEVERDRKQRAAAGRAGGLARSRMLRKAGASAQETVGEPVGEPPSEPSSDPPGDSASDPPHSAPSGPPSPRPFPSRPDPKGNYEPARNGGGGSAQDSASFHHVASILPGLGVAAPAPQPDQWESYQREQWAPFREAWQARFSLPPTGARDGTERSQRELLWPIADARPNDLGRWVREAPGDATPFEVVGHVLRRWREAQGRVADG